MASTHHPTRCDKHPCKNDQQKNRAKFMRTNIKVKWVIVVRCRHSKSKKSWVYAKGTRHVLGLKQDYPYHWGWVMIYKRMNLSSINWTKTTSHLPVYGTCNIQNKQEQVLVMCLPISFITRITWQLQFHFIHLLICYLKLFFDNFTLTTLLRNYNYMALLRNYNYMASTIPI